MEFTNQDIADWRKYERVRLSGAFNMFDAHNASRAAKLSRARYMFILKNYSALKEQAQKEKQ
jgi:hypothetical protein